MKIKSSRRYLISFLASAAYYGRRSLNRKFRMTRIGSK